MKEYKWGKGLGFIMLCTIGGGILGFTFSALESQIKTTAFISALKKFAPNLFFIACACGVMGLLGYFYFNHLLREDHYSNEEGSLFERNENKISTFMTLSTICVIINFTAFGVNLLSELPGLYMIVFMINVVLGFIGEVANVSLVKKVRPELNADPMEINFNKHYFDKLDECEKIKIGKASYKTISEMLFVYVTVFLVCWLAIMMFEVSPLICLPVGVIWFMQTILMLYHSYEQK